VTRAVRLASALGALATAAAPAVESQSPSVGAARWLTTPHVSDYRLSIGRRRIGPVVVVPFGQVAVQGPRQDDAVLLGGGGDLVLLLSADARPYLVAGVSGGFIDLERSLGLALWGSWSGGAGAELVRLGPVALAAEARYQRLSRGATGGISLGVRLGAAFGRGAGRPHDEGAPRAVAAPAPGRAPPARPALATVAAGYRGLEVADVARQAMGSPYRWGGSDQNGFDCSGLIRFAYGEIGIEVPRRSRDQAGAGRAIPRNVAELLPGDILAFGAEPGEGPASHVGLYLGQGRFIHSASAGVRISALDDRDPDGRWWHARWIGARRILD
jgi:cell wall-associated NlpC family hydrolase